MLPSNALLSTAMEMLAGGALMLIAGVLLGEGAQIRFDRISLLSLSALGYLVAFGSLIGFTAYVWLLKVSTPARFDVRLCESSRRRVSGLDVRG
jgi:drug/metabolite transporter (DMT)-like permease